MTKEVQVFNSISLIIVILLLSLNLTGQKLDKHKWNNRILIVQANTGSMIKYQRQINLFDNLEVEFEERKLIVYEVIGNKYRSINYVETSKKSEWKIIESSFRKFLGDTDKFRIILIGLDGSIKLQKTELLEGNKLFDKIDSMPMRKVELSKRRK